MKKLLTVLAASVAMAFATSAYAQNWTAAGGFSFFQLSGSDADQVSDESIPGFYFGLNYDYAFSTIEGLTVEPGVYFMHYGKTFSFQGIAEKSYHSNYIRVPVNLKYSYPLTGNFSISGFTGPRFNIGVGGNMFSKGDTYMGLKAFDFQWGLGAAGLISDAIMVRIGYDFGITKCVKDNMDLHFDNLNIHRNTFYVGIGFTF